MRSICASIMIAACVVVLAPLTGFADYRFWYTVQKSVGGDKDVKVGHICFPDSPNLDPHKGNCYPTTVFAEAVAMRATELQIGRADQQIAQLAALNAKIHALTTVLEKQHQANENRYATELPKMQAKLIEEIEAIPEEMAKDGTAYRALRDKLIKDVKVTFGLEPK